jgi:hypothetical protein
MVQDTLVDVSSNVALPRLLFDPVNQRLYWVAGHTLAYNQFPSYQRTGLDNAFASRDYWSVDVSGDGEKILVTRLDRVMTTDDCHQDIYFNAYIMDKDGGEVYKLDIPF